MKKFACIFLFLLSPLNEAQDLSLDEQVQKGNQYYFGTEGVDRNYEEAFKWFDLAVKQGHQEHESYQELKMTFE